MKPILLRSGLAETAPASSLRLTGCGPIRPAAAVLRAFFAEAAYRVAAGQPEVFEGQS